MYTANSKVADKPQVSEIESPKCGLSYSTLDVLFWMLEDSGSKTLEQQGAKLLKRHFGTLEAAREYRSAKEAEQFMLNHIFAKQPQLRSLQAQ